MKNSLTRILKLADVMIQSQDIESLERLCTQFQAFVARRVMVAHMVPENDGTAPNPWKTNMDYAGYENSPYFGNVSHFLEKFPGGIKDWVEWRRKTQKERNQMWDTKNIKERTAYLEILMKTAEDEESGLKSEAHFIPVGPDDTKKFKNEPHLYSGDMDKFKDIKEFVKKHHRHMRGNNASDGALEAVNDFIAYWQELKKGKNRRKQKKSKGKK